MTVRQVGERSTTYWIATVVVILIPGLWTSWSAWSIAAPFGTRLATGELPREYVLLTCSLLCLYPAALLGGWVVRRSGRGQRWAPSPATVFTGAVTLYGVIAATVFALATDSEWSLAAVLPLGLMGYYHFRMVKLGRSERAGSREGAAVTAGGAGSA